MNECDLNPSVEKCIGKCDWWLERDNEIICCQSLMRSPKFAEALGRISVQKSNQKETQENE